MNIKRNLKKGVAILGAGALGTLAGNTLNAQDVNTQQKDSVEIVNPYMILTPKYQNINFNDNKDPRYTNRPSFNAVSNATSLKANFESGFLQGLDFNDIKVITESIDKKMTSTETFGRSGQQPLPAEIANFMTYILNNEGMYKKGKVEINRKIGEIDSIEYKQLFDLFARSDYNEFFGYVVKHNNPTKTKTWDPITGDWKKDKKGDIAYTYNPAQNIAIPFLVRLTQDADCKPDVSKNAGKENYSTSESTKTESEEKSESPIRAYVDNSIRVGVGAGAGRNLGSGTTIGQGQLGLQKGRLELIALGGAGFSSKENSMEFPSNVGGTEITDYVKTMRSQFGGLIDYDLLYNRKGNPVLGILAGVQKDKATIEKNQMIRQWVTDALGNYRDVTFEGPSTRTTESHYDLKGGISVPFGDGWSLQLVGDYNLNSKNLDALSFAVMKYFNFSKY